MNERKTAQLRKSGQNNLGLVWVYCTDRIFCLGIERLLATKINLRCGRQVPTETDLSCVICPYGPNVNSELKRLRTLVPEVPIVVFGLRPDLDLARVAMKEKVQGFVHAEMRPASIVNALSLTLKGAYVVPKELSEEVVSEENLSSELAILDSSQRDRLKLKLERLA